MLVEIGLQGEGFLTPLALKVLESRMRLHVRPQVRSVGETFATVRAAVGLVPGVAAHVAL